MKAKNRKAFSKYSCFLPISSLRNIAGKSPKKQSEEGGSKFSEKK